MATARVARMAAADRRTQLLRAATTVFARTNYRAARTADIAAEAGVSEPLLYRHFPSKKALFCELLDRIGRRIIEVWEADLVQASDALDALDRAGRRYLVNLAEHPAEAQLQFQALAEVGDPDIALVLRANHARYVCFFTDLIVRGQQEGVIRSDLDVAALAWLLDGLGVSFTVRGLLDGPAPADTRTIDAVIAWLAHPDDPRSRP